MSIVKSRWYQLIVSAPSQQVPPGYVRLHTNYGDLNLELYCDQVSAEVLLFPDNMALSFMSILSCRSPRLARTFSDTAEKATTMTPVSGRHICTLTQYIDHTHTHARTHTHTHTHMHTHTCICTHARTHACTNACTHTCTHAHTHSISPLNSKLYGELY